MQTEHIADAIKATPVAGFIGTSLMGWQWDTFSYVVASAYTCLMICEKLWRWYKAWQAKKNDVPES